LNIDAALPLCESVRAEQRALQEIRDRLASRYDDVLIVPLIRLQEDLQAGGGAIERITITPNARADGKPLSDVDLPEGVRIVLVRRNDALMFPSVQMVLRAGDQVTVLGNRSALPGAIQSLLA
jgi:Trk K+ transport system NAD-binding subunit